MRTIRRLLYRDILASVFFVALAFLSLFFFIDFVDELDGVGQQGRTAWHALLAAAYELPSHLYELMPIAVLIGTIYSLSRMAQSSEFTILRTGGLGPRRALALLAALGAGFAALTFVLGDWLAPASEREAVALAARFDGGLALGGSGAWLKERRNAGDGTPRAVSVNVQGIDGDGRLQGVRLFEFDADGRLLTRVQARGAEVLRDGRWLLLEAGVSRWPVPAAAAAATQPAVQQTRHARLEWPSTLSADVVAAAVLPLGTMTTAELWRYARHLTSQEQASQRYQLQFWKKAFYPFACLVMVALALPFAYLHARAGGVSLKVFGGIMLGIAFVLLNNLAGHVGLLADWTPWIVAAAPGLLFLALSLGAFAWLVRYR